MRSESGIALIAALLLMLLMSTLLAGFTVVVMSDQQGRWVDAERTKSFYASHAGIEKMTADLGVLFATNVAPTAAQLQALQQTAPQMPNVGFTAADGSSGYTISFSSCDQHGQNCDPNGNPYAQVREISSGPFQGMTGLVTTYTMDVTARTAAGGETHLRRRIQTAAIPVFQFGIFSDTDLSFFPGPTFNFGGRVHSNGNLFLAAGSGLTLADRVTAVGEVVRQKLSNGWSTTNGYTADVAVVTTPGNFRPLGMNEGSVQGTIGDPLNDPTWTDLVTGPYAGSLRNGRTGARRLDLALTTIGGQPLDLVRRPASPNENTTNPGLFHQRYFATASLRILLSDSVAKIENLPSVTPQSPLGPVSLEADWSAGGGPQNYPLGPGNPPISMSGGIYQGSPYATPVGQTTLGGYIKIEAQNPAGGTWRDVTSEILNLGIGGANVSNQACGNVSPTAVIRLVRVANTPANGAPCGTGVGVQLATTDVWPLALYDPREGLVRDVVPANPAMVALGGLMYYVELDVNNLSKWFNGTIGTTGTNVYNTTGYVVYFSDRRLNRDPNGNETGEYGFEDTVNPNDPNGAPNGLLDPGEDINGDHTFRVYGGTAVPPPGAANGPLANPANTPLTFVDVATAQVNRAVFFRRALKLTNGQLGNIIAPGLTVVSENPVYIQGDYNAGAGQAFGSPHVATAVIADAVTLLSNNWSDNTSFTNPHNLGGRPAVNTWYRVAVMAGKTPSFPQPVWGAPQDFGTDGGVHNFLRYIENWGNGSTLWYRGSLASFYFSRQAAGTFKCCSVVYSPPTRGYNFDIEFLTPSLLPPQTPVFRDLNALGFTQITAAGR